MQIIKPVRNGILVELVQKSKETSSGFILTNKDETEQVKGKIIALGNGIGEEKDFIKELSAGMVILFGKYSGEEIASESDDKTYKLIQSKDVIAVVEDK